MTNPQPREYTIETSENGGRTWRGIPGVVFRVAFHDGELCQYNAGGAFEAAMDAANRLQADPDLGRDLYRVAGR